MEQRTVTIKNFLRITKIVQVSAMKVHFQIAERSLFYLNPDIHFRRMTYPPERGKLSATTPEELGKNEFTFIICIRH
jgi:hypothetical protein